MLTDTVFLGICDKIIIFCQNVSQILVVLLPLDWLSFPCTVFRINLILLKTGCRNKFLSCHRNTTQNS